MGQAPETNTQPTPPAFEVAGTRRRLAALLIDCVLAAGVAALVTSPEPPRLASAAVLFGYYTFFTGLFGQTIGMRLLGLACVRIADGGRIGIIRACARTVLLQIVVPAVFTNKRGQGWHDRAAKSLIVRVNVAASSSSVAARSSAPGPAELAAANPARPGARR